MYTRHGMAWHGTAWHKTKIILFLFNLNLNVNFHSLFGMKRVKGIQLSSEFIKMFLHHPNHGCLVRFRLKLLIVFASFRATTSHQICRCIMKL